MKSFTILSISLLFLLTACADRTWQTEYDEVMYIHDEVMPEIKTIKKIKKKIKKYKETSTDPTQTEQALNLMRDLDKAEESMFDWMNAFNKPSGSMEHEKAVAYLKAEKTKISQVSKDMKSSIAAGEAFLKKIGAAQ